MIRYSYLLIIFTAGLAHAASQPFQDLISEDADVFLTIRDLSDLHENYKEHPLVLDLAAEPLQGVYQQLFDQEPEAEGQSDFTKVMEEEFGLDWDELFTLFPGQAAVALYNLPELILEKEDRPNLAIMAEYAGSKDRLDELMQIQFERNAKAHKELDPNIEHEMVEERFMGETLHFDEVYDGEKTYVEDGYALVDGIFVLATPEERLRSMVESIKAGADQPISRNAAYQRAREESGQADLIGYVNFESFLPTLNEALMNKSMSSGMAMFGVSAKSLDAALALSSLQALSIDFQIDKEGATSNSAVVYLEKTGLLRLLAYREGVLPEAAYVPEDVLASTVSRFDLSEMLKQLESLLGVASPSSPGLLNIQLQKIKTETGVDLRRSILENFGEEIVSFSILPERSPDSEGLLEPQQVYVMQINDATSFSGALEAVKDLVPGLRAQIKTREYEGEVINTVVAAGPSSGMGEAAYDFSYVVTRSHLLITVGQPGLIQTVLSGMQSQRSGFWQMDSIRALFAKMDKENPVSRSYVDLGEMVRSVALNLSQMSVLYGNDPTDNLAEFPEDYRLPWHCLTETYEAPDGIFSRTILLRKED